MNFLCPACRTPLPRAAPEHVTCTGCGVAVDLTRVDTAPGQARLWPEIDLSGETLSGYSLLRLLGSGGMGSVYEARGPDGTVIALKVLSPLLAAEPALRERFRREARALSALTHPGIVKMLGEGEEQGFCWYAMERVTGQDLRERLKAGPLPVPEVIALGKAMLDALEVVHASGFIHRDVKPSNILLSAEGPKLCDFGIARFEGASTLTESAALLGSLRYMAPEQRWGKSDARSDLYALGVVLHEALALGVPGERTLPPSTPASLARAIAKLTEANAVLRPQSATAAKRLLLASSKRPVQLAVVAVFLVLAVGVPYLAVESLEWGAKEVAIVDAGPAFAAAPDAGANPTVDAGFAEALAAVDAPDAGEAADAGTALLALAEVDAGTRFIDILRGSGTTPPPKSPRIGKPTKSELPSKLIDDTGALGGLGTKGGTGTFGTTASPKKKKPMGKVPVELPGGQLIVAGVGPAQVYDGKTLLGAAPGNFDVAFGGHAVVVVCDVGGKRQTFKVSVGGKSRSTQVDYACPES
ncbi:MAG: serine/threonine-protein kinase [Archangium sp.]|nr:serine/threonine-protein kinase [Archangium sp.]